MRPLLTLLALAMAVAPLHAWNEVGHMAVGRVAYREMDDGLKLRVAKLLKTHPHYDEYLTKNCPPDVPVAEWAFLRASTWPDWIRPRKDDPRGERVTKYHRPSDHYVNVPIIAPADAERFRDLKTDPDLSDITTAFRQRMTEAKLKTMADADRAVAICWITHLIGDVHQPLHAANYYSADYPDGDLGGNRFGVTADGVGVKLHAYWDNALGKMAGSDDGPSDRQSRLYVKLTEIDESLRDPRYARDKLPELATNKAFPSWVRESHELAVHVVYLDGKLKGATVGPNGVVPQSAPALSAEYQTAAKETAHLRVVMSGYRLADKLKEALPRD